MSKVNGGKEGSPVDVYIISLGKEDSWKGTPLDVEEDQLKAEPTTTKPASDAVSKSSDSPPLNTNEKESNKINEHSVVTKSNVVKNVKKSPFPRVCPPTQKELEAFRKSSTVAASPTTQATLSSEEALKSPESKIAADKFSPMKDKETAVERQVDPATAVPSQTPSQSPPPAVQLPAAGPAADGNGARKELEDSIQRIEAHIKTEQAARRAAEGALAQARKQSQDTSPAALQSLSPLIPSYAEFQVALEDLANAQHAVQRAHAVVAYILSSQQQQRHQTGPGKFEPALSIKEKKDTQLSSPGIRHTATAPSSPSVGASPLALYDGTGTGISDVPSSPTLDKVVTKERGMSWVAGGLKEPSMKQNWTIPHLKVKTGGAVHESSEGSGKGEKSPTVGALRKKESNNLSSSPKTDTPLAASRKGDSGFSPTRGGNGGSRSLTAPEWNNDRFATGKAEAFMLNQAARWNSNAKGK